MSRRHDLVKNTAPFLLLVRTYPSADIPFNAIAAGKDFICGLMAHVCIPRSL
jgi:hypothetical protein